MHEVPVPSAAGAGSQSLLLVPGSRREAQYLSNSPPKLALLSPPGPSEPLRHSHHSHSHVPRHSSSPPSSSHRHHGHHHHSHHGSSSKHDRSVEKELAKAEEKAARAEARYRDSGHSDDRHEALRAREKLKEAMRRADAARSASYPHGDVIRG